MINPQDLFSTIQEQVSQILPEVAKPGQEELMANIKLMVGGVINKLDLVSREEFEAQQAVLLRTREKLEQLEKDFVKLEAALNSGQAAEQTGEQD